MSNQIELILSIQVGAHAAQTYLNSIPTMPPIQGVTVTGTKLCVAFEEDPSSETISLLQNVASQIPLEARKISLANKMSEDTHAVIVGGFPSTATGVEYWYDSDLEAQLNLVGAAVAQQDLFWHVSITKDGDKQPILHTHAQIVQVGTEFAQFKGARIFHFQSVRAQVSQAVTMDQLASLEANWNPEA